MTIESISVRSIRQKDNHTFSIEWSDGTKCDYRLSELQKKCPCAACVDEVSGKRLIDPRTILDDVRAIKIISVGRYALKIQFTSGCSMGIYSFNMLQDLNGYSPQKVD